MPVNKRESLIFTVLMCAFMVYVMTLYNIARVNGVSTSLFSEAWLGFPIAYAVAFISDWFIWGKHAKRIAFKIIGHNPPVWKMVLGISGSMVSGMVVIMSLFGAIHAVGISSQTFIVWLLNIPANFVVALPLQILIAGPIVRFVFRAVFPIGIITE